MAINVMIIDDSAVVRQVLSAVLNEADDIRVISVASDPIIAKMHMERNWPDVIVLDIEMPRMDGLSFLQEIMQTHPTPVVICSSLATKGCALTLQALSLGAVDIITKPTLSIKHFLLETRQVFWQAVRTAAKSNIKSQQRIIVENSKPHAVKKNIRVAALSATTDRIIAVGTSTGGTIALEYLVKELPRTTPGMIVVQHMPEAFTKAFAARLNEVSELEVIEAESGLRLIPGRILIAPGGHHTEVQCSGAQYIVRVFRGPPVNRHCPSVDVLFRSVAKNVGRNATGIIMTGMGDDGAQGLLAMRNSGAFTIAQDEATSVVFGMPKEAIKLGAVETVCGLHSIPSQLHA